MPAPKRNQFAKGNKGGGRKGYEYEEKQLKLMREIVSRGLKLTKKILDGEASIREVMAYENALKMTLKAMDKLHANRQETKMDVTSGEEPMGVVFLPRRLDGRDDQK